MRTLRELPSVRQCPQRPGTLSYVPVFPQVRTALRERRCGRCGRCLSSRGHRNRGCRISLSVFQPPVGSSATGEEATPAGPGEVASSPVCEGKSHVGGGMPGRRSNARLKGRMAGAAQARGAPRAAWGAPLACRHPKALPRACEDTGHCIPPPTWLCGPCPLSPRGHRGARSDAPDGDVSCGEAIGEAGSSPLPPPQRRRPSLTSADPYLGRQ